MVFGLYSTYMDSTHPLLNSRQDRARSRDTLTPSPPPPNPRPLYPCLGTLQWAIFGFYPTHIDSIYPLPPSCIDCATFRYLSAMSSASVDPRLPYSQARHVPTTKLSIKLDINPLQPVPPSFAYRSRELSVPLPQPHPPTSV